jgi:hypothetical protein
MRITVYRYNSFQELWNRLCEIFRNTSGEIHLGDDTPVGEDTPDTNQSQIKIGRTLYIVNSRYNGKENIIDKFKRLITRKMESQSKGN